MKGDPGEVGETCVSPVGGNEVWMKDEEFFRIPCEPYCEQVNVIDWCKRIVSITHPWGASACFHQSEGLPSVESPSCKKALYGVLGCSETNGGCSTCNSAATESYSQAG